MKFRQLALSAVAGYGLALAAALYWPAGREDSSGKHKATATAVAVADARMSAKGGGGGHWEREAGDRMENRAGTGNSAAGPVPTMDEVFKAAGLHRMLLMARFIQTASPAQLEEALRRSREMHISEFTFTDQIWLRWVELNPDAALNHQPMGEAWWALAKVDPQAALERAEKAGNVALGKVLHSIAQSDPARARELLAKYPGVDAREVERGMLDGFSHQDPGAAVAFALEKESYGLDGKFREWMNQDPEKAEAWVRGLTDPAQRRRMEDLVLTRHIEADPAAGLEEARRLPAGRRQMAGMIEAIAALTLRDPEAARAAADILPPSGVFRQKALEAITRSLASYDPESAVAMVPRLDWSSFTRVETLWSYEDHKENGPSMGGRSSDLMSVVDALMGSAPEATANALAALPESGGVPMARAIRKWAASEPEAASSWLGGQPEGPLKDQGITALTTWLSMESPEPDFPSALAWAGAVSPHLQFALMYDTLARWSTQDRSAARAAVEELAVSPEQKERLFKSLR